jgi:hypothetical protein
VIDLNRRPQRLCDVELEFIIGDFAAMLRSFLARDLDVYAELNSGKYRETA